MKKALNVILLALAIVVCGSCNKSVFSNGDLVTRDGTISEPFRHIELCDNVNVTLKQCDNDHIAGYYIIETGENLIDNITATIRNDGDKNCLVIRNNNTNDFLRPYDYDLNMTVWYDTLYAITFNSNGTVHTDPLRGCVVCDSTFAINDSITIDSVTKKNEIHIRITGGSGDLHLLIDSALLYTEYVDGTACVYAEGFSIYTYTKTNYQCHGIIDYSNLKSLNHDIYHSGTNRIYTKVSKRLYANNINNGEICYVKFLEKRYDYFEPDEEHPWGYHDSIWHYCPENIVYNGKWINNSWHYDNDEPGLILNNP